MATCGSLLINWKFLQQDPCLGNRCQGYKRKLFYNLDFSQFHRFRNTLYSFRSSFFVPILYSKNICIWEYQFEFHDKHAQKLFFSFCGSFVNISMVTFKLSRSLLFLSFLCLQITTKHFEVATVFWHRISSAGSQNCLHTRYIKPPQKCRWCRLVIESLLYFHYNFVGDH